MGNQQSSQLLLWKKHLIP